MQAETEAAPRRTAGAQTGQVGALRGRALPRPRVPRPAPARRRTQVRQPAGPDQLRLRHRRRGLLEAASLLCLQPAHPHRAAPRGTAPVAAAADQPVEPVGEPHRAGGHRAGHRRRLPPAHAVGCVGSRRRLRPGHAGRGLGRWCSIRSCGWRCSSRCSSTATTRSTPWPPGRGSCSWAWSPGSSWRSRGAATAPSRSAVAGRTASPSSTATRLAVQAHRVAERLGQFLAEPQVLARCHRLGRGLLAARRGLAVRVHRRAGEDRVAHRPAGRLRPGPGARRDPHHAVGPRRGRRRAHPDPGRLRRPPGDGHPRRPRLPPRELLAAHPVGGIAYLSLRFSGEGWCQRLRQARDEVVSLDDSGVRRHPATPSPRSADSSPDPPT